MKRKCKKVDLLDYHNLIPAVEDVVFRHAKRFDFKNLLLKFGLSLSDYRLYLITNNKRLLDQAIGEIAKECAYRIASRDLKLSRVDIRIKVDKSTGKVRQIGKESAMQQVFDYIAFYSAKEIFDARIVSEQASSIPGRGQIYGMKMIRNWIRKDNDAYRYAKRHGFRYSRKCRYFVKCDITKCYPSARIDCFLKLFQRDCANTHVLWLWQTLLRSHQIDGYSGFMIGSLVSQWAVQYMMSFAYRHVKGLHYERRGKAFKNVGHMLIFMDDILLIGSNRKQLRSAVRELDRYLNDELGFHLKQNWQILDINSDPIDMMGFVVYSNGHVEIRGRDFIRARRLVLRYRMNNSFLTVRQCKRILSYKGYFMYSDSRNVSRRYRLKEIFRYAAKKISVEERRKNAEQKGKQFDKTG